MTKHEFSPDYQDCFEYHGSTVIELTRKRAGVTVNRDWILFDSVEEATDYFNHSCGEFRRDYVQ